MNLAGAAPEPQGNMQCSPSLGCCPAELLSPREGEINPHNLWVFSKLKIDLVPVASVQELRSLSTGASR